MIRLALAGIMTTLLAGCATVPDDAPQAFHDAKKSIDRMDEADVDAYLPKTTNRAHESFSEALSMLDDVEDGEPTASEAAAINRALQAKETADGALQVYDRITLWDADEEEFQNALAADNVTIVAARRTTVSPFAALKGEEMTSNVAFFRTGQAEPEFIGDEIESLAAILEKDPSYKVTLTGYADPRGDSGFNDQLALRRAKAVAESLRDHGVRKDQISVKSGGESGDESASAGELQLQRRVQGVINF